MNKLELEKGLTLIHGDCLVEMQNIPNKSIDAIICDLPYGTIACSWDSIIPFDKLWERYNRIIKDNGAICLFGSEPFSSYLRMSNIQHYKYDWIWKKTTSTGFQHAKNMPLKNYEIISVFSNGSMGHKSLLGNKRMTYNPQGIARVDKVSKNTKNKWGNIAGHRPSHKEEFITEFANYPTMVLEYQIDKRIGHPTAKPVSLIEYLIKTYSNEGDLILDNTAGSMTTAIAAINTNRKCICIEKDDKYFELGSERVRKHLEEQKSRLF